MATAADGTQQQAGGQVSAAVAAFKAMEGKETMKLENTSKRDFLIDLEKKYQKEWEEAKLFEVNSPATEDQSLQNLSGEELRQKYPKFFGTFPYPYMNGSLHLGHGFTISKIEFATGFERMLGKRALFPVGFHCTGMPIKAAADKLVREMEMFGADFENYRDPDEVEINGAQDVPVSTQPASNVDATAPTTSTTTGNQDKSKKSKVNAKSTGLKYQFQIMEAIGISRSEIKNFADPQYWVKYFPPIAREDLTALGARVDWRRSFITTDANPYYDSFVRWQITRLRDLGYIKYGKRHTIYSPKDGQPCMDHDRASGEAVGPQEYTGLKMEVLEWSEHTKDLGQKLAGKKPYLIAATLRSETTYAQINAWVGTGITYGMYEAADGESVYIMTERAARNMAFQDILKESGKWPSLGEVKGADLIGTKVAPPNSLVREVYVLPMDNVSATKGTGIVTSCPSDSPDDYATYMDLRKKPEYYKIDPSWVAIEPVAVLETAQYGQFTAIELCKQFKINSQKDVKQLAEAKEIAYSKGFYEGTMLVGPYKGMPVQEAKPLVRKDLLSAGLAIDYQEPMSLIMSRSGDECIVALQDQWYMDYGSDEWKPKAQKLLANMETYNETTRNAFEGVLNWLRQWACARSFGLGTRVPFDKSQLVESLSDSTIYMAYYTIAHLLQGGVVNGSQTGPLGIKPEDLTYETWDYIFGRADFPKDATITREQGEALRREYTYFYPMDIRSSGKDLIPNHLTFCIYVHAALFPESMWPKSMRANGHLLLNTKKMSKSTGNFLTLKESVLKFGADATRLALATAGDGIEDANFDEEVANASILRFHKMADWCKEQVATKDTMRTGEKNFWDVAFESECNSLIIKAKQCYEEACYKDAMKFGFFELQRVRDEYIVAVDQDKPHRDLIFWWIRMQALAVTPVAPHFAELVWKEILQEPTSVQTALFPEPSAPVNQSALDAVTYVKSLVTSMRQAELGFVKKKAKGKGAGGFDPAKPKGVRLFIAKDFPAWQTQCIESIREAYDTTSQKTDNAKLKELLGGKGLLKDKRAMPFCVSFTKKIQSGEASFDRATTFDEAETINTVFSYIQKQLKLDELELIFTEEGLQRAQEFGADATSKGYDTRIIESAEPGAPATVYYNVSK